MSQKLVKMCLKNKGPVSLPHHFAHMPVVPCDVKRQCKSLFSQAILSLTYNCTSLEKKQKIRNKGKAVLLVKRCKSKANWKARAIVRVR